MRYLNAALAILIFCHVPLASAQTEDPRGFDIVDLEAKGFVTQDEYLAKFTDKTKALAEFQAMDQDGDGKVTKEEFLLVKPVKTK